MRGGEQFLADFLPLAGRYYTLIAGAEEPISLGYESQLLYGAFADLLRQGLERDLALQRTGVGIHRDDIGLGICGSAVQDHGVAGPAKESAFCVKTGGI